jgi:hypothetical protein
MRSLTRTAALTAVPSSASSNVETTSSTLERICVARVGSFHVNTYDGTNPICSAPRMLGDFAAEQTLRDRANGTFSRTQIVDGRASWFCHTGD